MAQINPAKLDKEHVDALLAGYLRRTQECKAACERAAQIRERDGDYPTADVDRFITNTLESMDDMATNIRRLIEALNP